jgi:hypothetical protein
MSKQDVALWLGIIAAIVSIPAGLVAIHEYYERTNSHIAVVPPPSLPDVKTGSIPDKKPVKPKPKVEKPPTSFWDDPIQWFRENSKPGDPLEPRYRD